MGTTARVTILGFLGGDPEVRYDRAGQAMVTLSVGTERYHAGESVTDWHRVACWRSEATFAQKYLAKGSPVFVEGTLAYRSFKDKRGVEVRLAEVLCSRLTWAGLRSASLNGTEAPSEGKPEPGADG